MQKAVDEHKLPAAKRVNETVDTPEQTKKQKTKTGVSVKKVAQPGPNNLSDRSPRNVEQPVREKSMKSSNAQPSDKEPIPETGDTPAIKKSNPREETFQPARPSQIKKAQKSVKREKIRFEESTAKKNNSRAVDAATEAEFRAAEERFEEVKQSIVAAINEGTNTIELRRSHIHSFPIE